MFRNVGIENPEAGELPKVSIQHTEHSERLKSRIKMLVSLYSHLPAYEDGTGCSETSACKIQTPGNYPKESIQHTEHDESLKLKVSVLYKPPVRTAL